MLPRGSTLRAAALAAAFATLVRGGAAEWTYKGCFKDSGDRAIPVDSPADGSLAGCIAYAESYGQNTVGMQYYDQCWVCNDCAYEREGGADNCPDGESGGAWQNKVWTTYKGGAYNLPPPAPVSRTYPPVGLTSNRFTLTGAEYGNGLYIADAGSTPSTAWLGFDRTASNWENCGVETCNQYCYQGSNYACGLAPTPLDDGGSYPGEWLQLTLPEPIQLTAYTLTSAWDDTSTPFSWLIAGSNDGATWHALDRRDELNGGRDAERTFDAQFASDAAFTTFRIIVSRSYMQSYDYNFIRLRELSLSGVPQSARPIHRLNLRAGSIRDDGAKPTWTVNAIGGGMYHLVPSSAEGLGNISFTVTATYSSDDVMRTLFDLGGVAFSIKPSAMDVGSADAGTVYVRDYASFQNNNRGSTMCSLGTYLTSSDPAFASWPADTEATIQFSIAADGTVAAPSIDGKPFESVAFPHDPNWVPACQPVQLDGSTPMVVGASASGKHAPFKGVIADLSVNVL